ncbi:hypothetical protein QEZ54_08510 [Catellatospora sp. KI3]|uniref:hypothetical protein n=1 Tax=Catellatospora sp. KI3 TaxID=3041620 RepID=UPI002482B3C3|nr:hypothetical protein [Catellatospora sp. KI3]MDI1461003.1 hypothetical protein [Catellatospora sp. KI3]
MTLRAGSGDHVNDPRLSVELEHAIDATYSSHDLRDRISKVEAALGAKPVGARLQYLYQLYRESKTVAGVAEADYERARVALGTLCDTWESLTIGRRNIQVRRAISGPAEAGWLYRESYTALLGTSFEIGITAARMLTQVEHVIGLVDALYRRMADLERAIATEYGQPGLIWFREVASNEPPRLPRGRSES